jgi:hypothetical protein
MMLEGATGSPDRKPLLTAASRDIVSWKSEELLHLQEKPLFNLLCRIRCPCVQFGYDLSSTFFFHHF